MKETVIGTIAYRSIKTLFDILALIPPEVGEKISLVLSKIWFALDKRRRNIAIDNIAHAFGDQMTSYEIKRMARKTFFYTVNMIFETPRAYTWKPGDLSKHYTVRGLYHLLAAQMRGKGVLLFSGHIGNWEISVQLNNISGLKVNGIYRKLDFLPFERYFHEKRESTGSRLYPLKGAAKAIFRELRLGNCMALLIDQNAKRHQGVFVDFFGRKACANKGPAQLALATGVPVIPYFFVRENGKYHFEVLPEIPIVKTGDMEKDILVNTQNFNRVIEDIIRRYPDQWLWIYNRWKTQPLVD
ncbi:MAG: lysophospholipid acyltransferase family protein [Desulfobacteraceae bacterium]|nr:lysophospholipid acyltransferase family protein [Desulfobacteraceae bacterium]MBC2756842.1 lysophospholipid acyltransferase family protein [Desulfobacteraceae bacterium]